MNMEKAKEFVTLNARPLDMARWNYHFEHGEKSKVIKLLMSYQNKDGGFGKGLEPDFLNPESSPMATRIAVNIIKEVGLADDEHPVITGILDYLDSGKHFDGSYWAWSIPSNDAYPHAPWWSFGYKDERGYNPSGTLAGFILKFAPYTSGLYSLAKTVAKRIFADLKSGKITSMHSLIGVVELYDYLIECNIDDLVDMVEFTLLIGKALSKVLEKDTSKWATEFSCKPSMFIQNKYSPFYQIYNNLCDAECKFLEKTQNADGTWDVTWSWMGAFPEEWSVAKNRWESDIIIKNIMYYRAICQ